MSPWTEEFNGFDQDDSDVVFNDPQEATDGSAHYQAIVRLQGVQSMTLTQSGIKILAGTTVDCTANIQSFRRPGDDYTTTFTLAVDGTTCGTVTLGYTGTYQAIGSNVVLSGNTHTVQVTFTSNNLPPQEYAGGLLDGVMLIPVAGPGSTTC